jgi:hypothetical protein
MINDQGKVFYLFAQDGVIDPVPVCSIRSPLVVITYYQQLSCSETIDGSPQSGFTEERKMNAPLVYGVVDPMVAVSQILAQPQPEMDL